MPHVSSDLHDKLVEFRRDLHTNPELSLEEYETTRKIRERLEEENIEVLDYNLATGVIAIVRGKRPGATIAVRADIDALPIVEETDLEFASTVYGKMHACGHDFHTSAVFGSALLARNLAQTEASFAGNMVFIFQPAEEVGGGAELIWKTGVFEDLAIQAIIGEHNNPLLERGKIGVTKGPLMASVDEFKIVVKGVGGHAAIPELTVDPIVVASNIVAGLQHIVSRNSSPHHAVVVTVGQFHAGTARNIIPPAAVIEGTVRCLQPEARQLVEERLRTFATQTAEAYGATAEVTYEYVLPGVVNDGALAEVVREAAQNVVGEDLVETAKPSLGGEDFAIYQQHIAGCFFWVGTGKGDGMSYGWHHPKFDVDESMLTITSEVFLKAALLYLEKSTQN